MKDDICPKCGEKKIFIERAVIGFPDYHVKGSRQRYCGYCDTPPTILLTSLPGKVELIPNEMEEL